MTCSARFTHISGYLSVAGRAQDRESSPAKDRRSTTVPRNHCRYVAPPGECYYTTITLQLFFIVECGIAPPAYIPVLLQICVFSKFRHHPYPLGYLCAKLGFFAASIAQLVHGEKSRTQSLDQSLTHSAYLMPLEPKRLRFGIYMNYPVITKVVDFLVLVNSE